MPGNMAKAFLERLECSGMDGAERHAVAMVEPICTEEVCGWDLVDMGWGDVGRERILGAEHGRSQRKRGGRCLSLILSYLVI